MLETASGPNRLPTLKLLTSTRAASYTQLNSVLVYPWAGMLFKLTFNWLVSPTWMLEGVTMVSTVASPVIAVAVKEGTLAEVAVLVGMDVLSGGASGLVS